MARLSGSATFVLDPNIIGTYKASQLQALFSSNIQSGEKADPPAPFVLHLAATQNQGNGNPMVERAFCAGQEGLTGTSDTQIGCVVEYGFGSAQNQVELDWVPGCYQFPPCDYVRVAARLRRTYDPVDRGLALRASIVPGVFPDAHVPTYTVRQNVDVAGLTFNVKVPAKARAYDLFASSDGTGICEASARSLTQPPLRRTFGLVDGYLSAPPWTPVALLPQNSVSEQIQCSFEEGSGNTVGAVVFYLQP